MGFMHFIDEKWHLLHPRHESPFIDGWDEISLDMPPQRYATLNMVRGSHVVISTAGVWSNLYMGQAENP